MKTLGLLAVFLSPMAFFFGAALPVVILFYLLKRKRVVKLVSSTVLWQRFLADTQANAPFQRLRHNWLLLLQLFLLALVIVAVARPSLVGSEAASRLRVMILDGSASMQSTDVKPSRFEQAREAALKWVDGLGDQDRMVVVDAAGRTEVKQSATTDKTALRRALRRCRAADAPTSLGEALRLAETLTRKQAGAEIHLFSDGAVPNLEEFENKNLPLVYHRVGERGHNLGIVSLDARVNPENPAERAIFAGVRNCGVKPWQTEVELRLDGDLIDVRPIEVAPSNSVPLVFLAPQTNDGIFTVRLKVEDDLAADNQASVMSLMPVPANVLLVTAGNRFLEKALGLAGGVRLTVTSVLPEDDKLFDVVVLDNVLPARWPGANLLAVNVMQTNWFAGFDTVEGPPIVDWTHAHPLLRFVSFDNVQVAKAYRVQAPSWAVPLVEAPETPLILAWEMEQGRVIWIGFDLLTSTWPLRMSFPIFMANAVEWLNPAAAAVEHLSIRAGQPFRLELSGGVGAAEVTAPDGSKRALVLEREGREIMVGDTYQEGQYTLRAGTNQVRFCVNLLDAAESDTWPRPELPLGRYGKVEASVRRAGLELWPWAAGGALALLLFEWWFYHRRTV